MVHQIGTAGGPDGPAPNNRFAAVETKFAAPVAMHLIHRPRLHTLLTAGLEGPVTVIAATAGWGKTLLAASWVATGAGGRAAAWVNLDEYDDDPRTFWATLARALLPVAGAEAGATLREVITGRAGPEDLPGQLAAALRRTERPVVLVLDGLHEVAAPEVHTGLLRLIERPLPTLSMLVTARRDPPWPLERLRLAGLLTEVRAEDLAIRDDEAAELFERLHLELTPSQLRQLVDRTEGWPAGLRLAGLHLQGRGDVNAAVAAFSGDDHSVAGYLVTEVLDQQSPELIAFLQKISIVELVCADLADTLTDRHDSAAVLTELAASHLFVQAIDRPGRWYRLHRLIADILRGRPAPRRERRDLHRRAAGWFAHQAMPLEAVSAAVAGELWPLAAELVGTHALALALHGRGRALERGMTAVPRTVLMQFPELAIGLAAARVIQGHDTEVGDLVAVGLAAATSRSGRRADRVRVLADMVLAGLARLSGDWFAAAEAHGRVPVDVVTLAALGISQVEVVPVTVHNSLGAAALWTGDLVAADRHLRLAVQADLPSSAISQLNASGYAALLRWERGELDPARETAQETVAAAVAAGWASTPQVVAAYLTMASVALDSGNSGEVDQWLGRVSEVETFAPEPHIQLSTALVLAGLREAAGEHERALSGFQAATAPLEAAPRPRALTERWLLTEATLLARGGDSARSHAVLMRLGPVVTPAAMPTAARLHLLLGDPLAATALRAEIAPGGHPRARTEIALLDTLLAVTEGDENVALDRLEDALAAAAPWNLRRPFLSGEVELQNLLARRIEQGTLAPAFAVDLLERMAGGPLTRTQAARALIDPLTDREQTVLRYLTSTLTTAEIAAELYVSINTVKTHQRTLYRKLTVSGRRAAVLRAREMHLL